MTRESLIIWEDYLRQRTEQFKEMQSKFSPVEQKVFSYTYRKLTESIESCMGLASKEMVAQLVAWLADSFKNEKEIETMTGGYPNTRELLSSIGRIITHDEDDPRDELDKLRIN